MKPGRFAFCSSCRHLDRPMSESGHPRPCLRVTWQGPALHKPAIDGGTCAEFEPTDQETPRVGPPTGGAPRSIFPPAPCNRATVLPSGPARPAPWLNHDRK